MKNIHYWLLIGIFLINPYLFSIDSKLESIVSIDRESEEEVVESDDQEEVAESEWNKKPLWKRLAIVFPVFLVGIIYPIFQLKKAGIRYRRALFYSRYMDPMHYMDDQDDFQIVQQDELISAARLGDFNRVWILSIGFSKHVEGKVNALHAASFQGNHEIVARLLAMGGADPNVTNDWNRTPLHFAAHQGHMQVVKVLLSAGANPKNPCELGRLPQDEAAREGHAEIVDLLRNYVPGSENVAREGLQRACMRLITGGRGIFGLVDSGLMAHVYYGRFQRDLYESIIRGEHYGDWAQVELDD